MKIPDPNNSPSFKLTRRQFLANASFTAAAVTIVPRHVLGGAKFVAPSEKINTAYIGCGTQGMRQMIEALKKPEIRIVAVCDPNRKSDDYPEWGPQEVNDKIRQFLHDPEWAKGA